MLLCYIAYNIEYAPTSMMYVLPTDDMVKEFSRDELNIMIQDTECLRNRVKETKAKGSDTTMYKKSFPGGVLNLAGAESPRSFRAKTVRVMMFDDVDGFNVTAGSEGDPVKLGEKRSLTYSDSKSILCSTPTLSLIHI